MYSVFTYIYLQNLALDVGKSTIHFELGLWELMVVSFEETEYRLMEHEAKKELEIVGLLQFLLGFFFGGGQDSKDRVECSIQ